MARTFKKGLDYFPLDIDIFNDLKIRKVSRWKSYNGICSAALQYLQEWVLYEVG